MIDEDNGVVELEGRKWEENKFHSWIIVFIDINFNVVIDYMVDSYSCQHI